jgi:hypothetical protein
MSTQSIEVRRLGGRPLVVLSLAVVVLLVAAGFAFASSRRDEAPVVTVDSTIQEQIGALEYQIDETRGEMGSDELTNEAREDRISLMEAKIVSLCGQLSPEDAAGVDACVAG